MLPQSNSIFRIVADPELKYSQSGMAILSIRLVTDNGMKDEQKKKTLWLSATAFGKTAEMINQWFKKGSRIEATVEYHTESWEKDGQKRSEIKGIVQKVGFVDKNETQGQQQPQQQYQAPQQQQAYGNPNNPPQQTQPIQVDEQVLPF